MDLFAKCAAYTTARECREKGIYPYFHALESRQDTEVIMEGRRRIMLGSNNYLGLTAAPEVVAAAEAALAEYGTGCSGSRFLNGTLRLHLELERELADFVHMDGAVTFSTCLSPRAASSSRTASFPWAATLRSCPRSANSPPGTARASWWTMPTGWAS